MTSERAYAALLRLYPRRIRRDYGADMLAAFSTVMESRGRSRAAFWRFIARDFIHSVATAHLDAWRRSHRTFIAEWVLACCVGAIGGALLTRWCAWAFSYFYHPFLEGMVVPAWADGATLGVSLGMCQAAVLRRRFHVGLSWIVATSISAGTGIQVAALVDAPAPAGDALLLGLVVAATQWALLRTRFRGPSRWLIASAAAAALSLCAAAAAVRAMSGGFGHVAAITQDAIGSAQPVVSGSIVLQGIAVGLFIAMLTAGLVSHADQERA